MKIAVISDIHGNIEALEAIWKDIKEQGCEKIFALGDYAMAGPEPEEAIKWFINKKDTDNITMIQGNTDLMIADYNGELYEKLKDKAPVMAEALKSDYKVISLANRTFLKNLPPQKLVEVDGVKILLVHGSPRKNNEDILPNKTVAEIEEIIKDVDANVILCGHTHIPCGFQTETKQTVVNVGSIGRPFTEEPKSCYLVMTITNGECLFEHRFVEYNIDRAVLKLKKRDFVGVNKLANNLLDPQARHF